MTLLIWSGYGANTVKLLLGKAPQVQLNSISPKESRESIEQKVGQEGAEDGIQVEQWLQKLTLDEKIGQMLLLDLSALAAERPSTPVSQLVTQLAPGGVILFKDDIKSVEQTITNNLQMLRSSQLPLWIGVDQEGGAVNRIPFVSDWNGNMAIAATGDPRFASETAFEMGKMLRLLFSTLTSLQSLT
ncbi:glycoside hydrolase family 3 N-terminal domain-containing protein [Paenibacillus alvei]|uniref:glycoside hydrolase family 3 N-terminal domain-containing protein n=1 Tax=Paenibacillus alvei TaxID=44250 RepID=UPI0006867B58|nr:glycoside hydrolase family 3 N-terminal domain-containing protein [Paenibacillus alvei]